MWCLILLFLSSLVGWTNPYFDECFCRVRQRTLGMRLCNREILGTHICRRILKRIKVLYFHNRNWDAMDNNRTQRRNFKSLDSSACLLFSSIRYLLSQPAHNYELWIHLDGRVHTKEQRRRPRQGNSSWKVPSLQSVCKFTGYACEEQDKEQQ
jgi:hypothetical protein